MSARRERVPLSGRSNKDALTSPIAMPGSSRTAQPKLSLGDREVSTSARGSARGSGRGSAVRFFVDSITFLQQMKLSSCLFWFLYDSLVLTFSCSFSSIHS